MKKVIKHVKKRLRKGHSLHTIAKDLEEQGMHHTHIQEVIEHVLHHHHTKHHKKRYRQSRWEALDVHSQMFIWMGIILAALVVGGYLFIPSYLEEKRWDTFDSGMYEKPVQVNLYNKPSFSPYHSVSYTLHPVAKFKISGKVAAKTYYNDRMPYSPFDAVIVWGLLAQEDFSGYIEFIQEDRTAFAFITDKKVYPSLFVTSHFANIHLVPANRNINTALALMEVDDIVYMEGKLVDVASTIIGRERETSTSRTDAGWDASEILYVERIDLKNVRYT